MKGREKTHREFMSEALQDPELREVYDELEEEYQLLRQLISARHKAGMTQAEVAEIMGTKTSAVGRLESALFYQKHSPTLTTLRRYAHALGCRVEIHLIPESDPHYI